MTYHLKAQYVATTEPISNENPTQVLKADSIEGYLSRASARRRQGLYDGAIADYDEVLAKEPNNLHAHRLRALTFHLKGDLNGAARAYMTVAQ